MSLPLPFTRSVLPWWLERIASVVARLLYRVQTRGSEHLPSGGALMLSNHLSYVDMVVLQMACPRPIRFVGFEGFLKVHPIYGWLFRVSGTIPLSATHALETTRRVVRALQAGELVCLFPEGSISRTGQLMKLRRGFEVMARRAGVPVVPVAHDGLWGSVFSFSGSRYLFKAPRMMRTHVFVAWGRPIPPEQATVVAVRQALLDLGSEAFDERPQLKRHLGREIVRGLARRPWRVEIVDRTAERREVKAGQVLAVSAAFARHLQRTVPENRVGIVLPPGAGATIANLAVVCAGKVPVNLNFTAGPAAVEAALRMSGVKTVISADVLRAKVPNFPWPERTLDFRREVAAMGGKRAILPWLIGAWLLPNQWIANLLGLPKRGDRIEAGLLFTSGSAGEPKGVVLTHRNVLANCWQMSSLSILPDTATLMACLPVFHSFGFTVTTWYPMIRGCRIVTVPSPLDTRKIVDAIKEEGVTVMVGAPTFLRPFLKKAEAGELRSLHIVVSGAERLPQDLYDGFLEKFNLEIMQGYGLTETSPVANVNQPDPAVVTETAEVQSGRRAGTVGRMMPGMTARILNPDTLAELPSDQTGMVALKGANVFPGYLNDPEKNQASFRDGWFITGDLGRFDEDGFLSIEGRLSRFSKIGGEMVPHGTIEQKLVEAFALDQSEGYAVAVVGVPDVNKGEALVLLAVVEISLEAVREKLLAAGLPNLWVPRVILRVEKIPVLGTGKLDVKGCREVALAG